MAEDTDDTRKKTTEISEWDQKCACPEPPCPPISTDVRAVIAVDQEMLFEIILAANYLDIKPLLDVGCKTVANMIKGKQPEEIRKLFNIVNDFTPEEEAQIKKEVRLFPLSNSTDISLRTPGQRTVKRCLRTHPHPSSALHTCQCARPSNLSVDRRVQHASVT